MKKTEIFRRYTVFIIGLFFAGIGVAFTKHGILGVTPISSVANVIMNSGEALVKAISDKTRFEFGYVKVGFDVFCVISAVVLSLIFFNGEIIGTREGTIISALCTGIVIKFITKFLRKPLEKIILHNIQNAVN